MRNFIKSITRKIKNFATSVAAKVNGVITRACVNTRMAVADNRGEGYIDTGVKIIIGVVIGGVILAGLYTLFNTTIIPTLTTKITAMFSYSGT